MQEYGTPKHLFNTNTEGLCLNVLVSVACMVYGFYYLALLCIQHATHIREPPAFHFHSYRWITSSQNALPCYAMQSVRLVCMLYLWVLWNILLAYGVFIIASPTHSKYSINVYLLGRVIDSLIQINHILIKWTIFLCRIFTELGGHCFWGKIPNGLLSSSLENCVDLSLGRTKQFALPITMNPGFIEVCN